MSILLFSFLQNFPNVQFFLQPSNQWDQTNEDSDSSSEDWENSLYSSEIDTSSSESDADDEMFMRLLPNVSKFLISH